MCIEGFSSRPVTKILVVLDKDKIMGMLYSCYLHHKNPTKKIEIAYLLDKLCVLLNYLVIH